MAIYFECYIVQLCIILCDTPVSAIPHKEENRTVVLVLLQTCITIYSHYQYKPAGKVLI